VRVRRAEIHLARELGRTLLLGRSDKQRFGRAEAGCEYEPCVLRIAGVRTVSGFDEVGRRAVRAEA
jgi:hypothetical protein